MEIVVGLVLMGTLLSASILALSKHRRQLVLAEQRVAACAVADDLLFQLSGQSGGFPLNASGPVAGHPNWRWQTSVVGLTNPFEIPMRVIRFEIVESNGSEKKRLVSVDVVKPAATENSGGQP